MWPQIWILEWLCYLNLLRNFNMWNSRGGIDLFIFLIGALRYQDCRCNIISSLNDVLWNFFLLIDPLFLKFLLTIRHNGIALLFYNFSATRFFLILSHLLRLIFKFDELIINLRGFLGKASFSHHCPMSLAFVLIFLFRNRTVKSLPNVLRSESFYLRMSSLNHDLMIIVFTLCFIYELWVQQFLCRRSFLSFTEALLDELADFLILYRI